MDIRNIAIIAHVDHGKTTLVDAMLRQSGTFRENQHIEERVMDRNDLEKERGITILAKPTAVIWNNIKINIIDTPGHADFGGEVERILSMVDGVVLLVDSAEGPLPQTKFVLSKALKLGIKPIVLVNKIDRSDARPEEVINEIFDLFCTLDASEEQLDFPILYASGRSGWAVKELSDERIDLKPLFDKVLEHVPAPTVDENAPFSMLATLLHADKFLGRILTGKVYSGIGRSNQSVKSIDLNGKVVEQFRLTKLQGYMGTEMVPIETARAGDIVAIAGMENSTVSNTICDIAINQPIKSTPIDPPTMSAVIMVNNSPFAGTEGTKVTSNLIKERLLKEAETNVAISVKQSGEGAFEVGGRGELQLGVLVETMRREGFELMISKPRVIFKEENGQRLEPIEEVVIDVDLAHSNGVISELNKRKGDMLEMKEGSDGRVRIIYNIPARCLIGYQNQFLTDTRGTGIMNRLFARYEPFKGEFIGRNVGVLISNESGTTTAYSLYALQDRGVMFVGDSVKVYEGMIVGENAKDNDLVVNVVRAKQLTNIRSAGADEKLTLIPPRQMTMEAMMSYIQDDEYVEVTPKSLRLRKKYLTETERKRYGNK